MLQGAKPGARPASGASLEDKKRQAESALRYILGYIDQLPSESFNITDVATLHNIPHKATAAKIAPAAGAIVGAGLGAAAIAFPAVALGIDTTIRVILVVDMVSSHYESAAQAVIREAERQHAECLRKIKERYDKED